MKGFPIAHIFHPSIPPMHAVVNNHNRNIDYWTVKRKFAEIVSTNDVNKIYSISNELRRVLSAITALNFYQGDVPSVMIRIQPENMSPFIIDISTGEHDDYIIQTLDVGTFAPFGEQCTCSAVNKKSWSVLRRRFLSIVQNSPEKKPSYPLRTLIKPPFLQIVGKFSFFHPIILIMIFIDYL